MSDRTINEPLAWALLLILHQRAGLAQYSALAPDWQTAEIGLRPCSGEQALLVNEAGRWRLAPAAARLFSLQPAARQLFDLYLPLLAVTAQPDQPFVIGHLGQSLDGRIATHNGASFYVTGPDNITHLHRLRALSDAVIVGAGTVRHDDPQLTTRRVPGANPVRVIIDTHARLGDHYGVFQDGAAPTLLARAAPDNANGNERGYGHAEVLPVPAVAGELDLHQLLAALARRGLRRLFVEGGGITVSRFLRRGLLNRLHIAVAPLIIGSGRPGISLPAIDTLSQGLRPPCRRFFMGDDVLFDCVLEPPQPSDPPQRGVE